MSSIKPMYQSSIWCENAEKADAFATKEAFCHGYNVYDEILPNASLIEYLYLLFKSEKPDQYQAKLLEKIAIAIANPGMRDLSVRAAMNAGVGGSAAASSLIAALSVGAGLYGGSREVYILVEKWLEFGTNLAKWSDYYQQTNHEIKVDTWDEIQHPAGFEPNGNLCPKIVLDTLYLLSELSPNKNLKWLKENRNNLESISNYPLSMSGVIACALHDLSFTPKQSEMLYLFLRLPGAAVHALEQEQLGWKKFPFFGNETVLTDDPGKQGLSSTKGTSDE